MLDLLLASLEFGGQSHPFAADRRPAFGREIAFELLTGTNQRLPDSHLKLGEQPSSAARVEITGSVDDLLELLELVTGQIGVGGEELTSFPNPNGHIPLERLGPNPPHRIEFFEVVAAQADTLRRGWWRLLSGQGDRFAFAAELPERGLMDHGCFLVVGVAPQRGRSEPQGRAMGAGRLRPGRERGQGGRFPANDGPGHHQSFLSDGGQEESVRSERIAGEFCQVHVGGIGAHRGEFACDRAGGLVLLEFDGKAAARELADKQRHRIAVGAEWRQFGGEHADRFVHRGIGEGRAHRPGHGLNRQFPDSTGRQFDIVFGGGNHEHPAGVIRQGCQALPIHRGPDSQARDHDTIGLRPGDNPGKLDRLDSAERRPVAEIEDDPAGGAFELIRGLLEGGNQFGGPEGGPGVQLGQHGLNRGPICGDEPFGEGGARHVDGRDGEAVDRPR